MATKATWATKKSLRKMDVKKVVSGLRVHSNSIEDWAEALPACRRRNGSIMAVSERKSAVAFLAKLEGIANTSLKTFPL